jgi:hypothetical protein
MTLEELLIKRPEFRYDNLIKLQPELARMKRLNIDHLRLLVGPRASVLPRLTAEEAKIVKSWAAFDIARTHLQES